MPRNSISPIIHQLSRELGFLQAAGRVKEEDAKSKEGEDNFPTITLANKVSCFVPFIFLFGIRRDFACVHVARVIFYEMNDATQMQ
jgi:hypothetical protein